MIAAALAPIHLPPDGMEMNSFWQPFMTFVQVIPVVLVAFYAYRRWVPKEPVLVTAVLVGGGMASLFEPVTDHLALVWFAPEGIWKMFETFGRPMPWFILPCYVWYVGGQTLLILSLLRRGIDRRSLFLLYGAFVLTNVIMEIPAIAAGIYTYYGPQPFEVAGLPLWFQSMNAAGPLVAAALIHRLSARPGWHPALALAVVPAAWAMSNAAAGWPMWSALNSTSSLAVTYAVGTVTLALAGVLTYLTVISVADPAPARQAAPAPAADQLPAERPAVATSTS